MHHSTITHGIGFIGIVAFVIGLSGPALAQPLAQQPATNDEMTAQHDIILQDLADVATNLEGKIQELTALVENLEPAPPPPLCGVGIGDQRFVVSQDNTEACDNTTGLHWELSESSGPLSHPDAVLHCLNLDLGNGHSYRLPEVKDLISLVDYSVPSFGSPPVGSDPPAGFLFPIVHPFIDVVPATYWSVSLNTANYSEAYYVTFNTGEVKLIELIPVVERHVWCVR